MVSADERYENAVDEVLGSVLTLYPLEYEGFAAMVNNMKNLGEPWNVIMVTVLKAFVEGIETGLWH